MRHDAAGLLLCKEDTLTSLQFEFLTQAANFSRENLFVRQILPLPP